MTYDIGYYRDRLRLNKHALDDALEEQADLMDRIGREVTRAARAEAEAEDALKREEGRLALALKRDGDKMTVPEVAAAVRTHRDRLAAMRAFLDAAERHSEWKGVYAAWKDRGYSIKELAGLHASSYFTASSHNMPRDRVGARSADREAIQRASGERRDERAARIAQESAVEAGAEPARPVRRRVTE